MKATKIPSPIRLILSIVDDGMGDEIEKYLDKNHLSTGLMFKGKGTAESEIADLFGFGMSDKIITALLVRQSKQDKIIKEITKLLGIEKENFGLTMLLEASSASSVVLDMLGIDII